MNRLPIIDLSQNENENREIVHAALRNIGFLYVKEHGVPADLITSLKAAAQSFFNRNPDEKMAIAMENAGYAWRGYFPVKGELTSGVPDLKEGLYFGVEQAADHPEVKKGTPLHGQNQWPANSRMREIVLEYMSEVKTVAEKLLRIIAGGLGLPPDYFAKRYGAEPTELFRIFNYPAPTGPQSLMGVHEHTDMGFLTILLQDENEGLEVKPRSADHWIEAPPIPGTFVVNIGDMLELWTQGIYQATLHRVQNKTANDRLSFPYFFDPSWHSKLEPIDPHLLRPDELAAVPPATTRKWDGTNIQSLSSDSTYGEFVWNKVRKVFPGL